jgi:predicted DNA binding CopG/RHH family protein
MIDQPEPEENEILDSFINGEFQSAPDLEKRKEELKLSAKATIRRNKDIRIKISERDFLELQREAIREGISYSDYIASILHKFASGLLVERESA